MLAQNMLIQLEQHPGETLFKFDICLTRFNLRTWLRKTSNYLYKIKTKIFCLWCTIDGVSGGLAEMKSWW